MYASRPVIHHDSHNNLPSQATAKDFEPLGFVFIVEVPGTPMMALLIIWNGYVWNYSIAVVLIKVACRKAPIC
jgi:hypothetical protein